MQINARKIDVLTTVVMLMLSAFGFTGCSHHGDITNEEENIEEFKISFQLLLRNSGAGRSADTEGSQPGTYVENYLDINDIQYLLFDKDANFLTDVTTTAQTVSASDDFTVYDVIAKTDDRYFTENKGGDIDFYILVLANTGNWNLQQQKPERGDNISSLFTTPPRLEAIPSTSELLKNPGSSEDEENRKFFPMAGLQHFRISGMWFATQIKEMPINLTQLSGKSVNMLRALAKIEIIDHINIPPEEIFNAEADCSNIRIKEVVANGYMRCGNLLPLQSQWDRNDVFETQQVSNPYPAGAEYYVEPPAIGTDTESSGTAELQFVYDEQATKQRDDNCPVYSCYLWEYSISELGTRQAPYFTVTVQSPSESESGEIQTEATSFQMIPALYSEGKPQQRLSSILRNHIYRFNINAIGKELNIYWTICPMDKVSGSITFK